MNYELYKWEIEPNPYDSDYDIMVTDDDDEARKAILYAAEMWLWDGNDGEERTLTVTHRPEAAGIDTKKGGTE